ncbi:MAG TPA: AAA family ATPase [Kofleriaceae bacterium]|nr:AAA family ATPase [Kofleriaceae bacterium]
MTADASIRRVRLLAEAALLRRFNAGVGFADARMPSQLFCRDAELAQRLGSGMLRSQGTHQHASAAVATLLAALQPGPPTASRIATLASRLAFDSLSRDIVEVCLAWEADLDTRALCDAVAGRRLESLPVDTLADIVGGDHTVAIVMALQAGAVLRSARLLRVEGEGLAATITLRPAVLRWLLGDDTLAPPLAGICELVPVAADPGPLGAQLPAPLRAQLAAVAASPGLRQMIVALRGPKGSGRRAAAQQLAATLRKPLLIVPVATALSHERYARASVFADAIAMARLHDAMVYFADIDSLVATASEGEAAQQEFAAAHVAELISQCSVATIVSTATRAPLGLLARAVHEVVLPPADLETRTAAFEAGLANRKVAVPAATLAHAPELAARYVLGVGAIAEILDEAEAHALAVAQPLEAAFVETAVARRLTMRLGSSGAVVARKAKFAELVVPDDVLESLHDMIAMVRQRSKILETWGFARHLGISRGVSALFSGEPGTGKTMAASVVASALGLELIRIDLSAVVSKYVGETEKNLSRIFDQAQQSHAMLLFDEADSLFGKRTELRSAQDRFANLEVNYILQRMETFDGISVLTTNAENAIDAALQRRLNFRIRFPEPEPAEREQLWRALLPPATEIVDAIDFTALAERFEMTGGYIKNAIVRAAVFAARAGRGVMAEDIWNGAYAEYAEMGKVMPQMSGPFGGSRDKR